MHEKGGQPNWKQDVCWFAVVGLLSMLDARSARAWKNARERSPRAVRPWRYSTWLMRGWRSGYDVGCGWMRAGSAKLRSQARLGLRADDGVDMVTPPVLL